MSQQSAIPNFSAFVFQCLRISASALCIYEYSITIYEERAYIWKAKLSFPAALFYIIRYSAILDAIWCILELVNWPGKSDLIGNFSCKILLRSELGLKLGLLRRPALVAVRVYAITQRTVWPVLPTLALYMVNPVVLLYLGIISQPIIRHGTCNTIGSTDRDTYVICGCRMLDPSCPLMSVVLLTKGTNIAGATTIASNGLALFITWLVTASIVTMRQLSTSKETLSIVLMNHGGIHFTLLSIAAVIGMAAGRNTEVVFSDNIMTDT
ncbi:hypothetical protein CERSUDRAFT_71418 [Gelatoporia subvermispora B]|uniref:DUF6533 domain-containing protein n=1 Tax=Ceriporiopsis subvermispora (strain B) TaxID=914234 RepID=M2RM15_CERS8|nr:hypothetical protein CERSUDRAFT_71418 [Gelatoporia subvermispora B]